MSFNINKYDPYSLAEMTPAPHIAPGTNKDKASILKIKYMIRRNFIENTKKSIVVIKYVCLSKANCNGVKLSKSHFINTFMETINATNSKKKSVDSLSR